MPELVILPPPELMHPALIPIKKQPRGFALIVTLSLTALLVLLVMALLAQTTTAVRTAAQEDTASVARANARLSLMLAMGELQKTTGPDTRVTANAGIVDPSKTDPPQVLGVWKSWEGADHKPGGDPSAGRPVSPGSDYKAVNLEKPGSCPGGFRCRRRCRPPTPPPCRMWPRARSPGGLAARARKPVV